VKLITEQIEVAAKKKAFAGNWDAHFAAFERHRPTIHQLFMMDDEGLETTLRREFPKQEKKIRAKLETEFGQSTVGEKWDVVAKRVLNRGKVLNDQEAETTREIGDRQIDYGEELLDEKNATRLTGLWQKFAAPINPAYKGNGPTSPRARD
jgi:hypothetical protein